MWRIARAHSLLLSANTQSLTNLRFVMSSTHFQFKRFMMYSLTLSPAKNLKIA